jgi:WD40 repeat protein/serine/threonine protein kinase
MKTTYEGALHELAEEFVARCRAGEEPRWQDYAADHPELAEAIEEIFPLMQFVDGAVSSRVTEGGGAGDDTLPALAREVVGDYRIVREVGRGGMGVVYEAEQISLKRRVALKVQSRGQASRGKSDMRFRQEAQAAAQLVHPHIVPVYDVGEDGEFAYYAMQLIEGQPLDEFIADVGRLQKPARVEPQDSRGESAHESTNGHAARPVSATRTSSPSGFDAISGSSASRRAYFCFVARLGAQVADALAFAHARSIIHRDVKPSNLLVDRELTAWVTDFGLAKVADSKLTQTGDVLGTVRYMAPEQFRGWADPRSDVYSLGATLYELVALRPPYEAPNRIELIRKITSDEPLLLKRLEPHVPRDLETIIHKCLRKESRERYESAAALRDDLQRFLSGEPIRARHDSLIYLTRKTMRRYRAALFAGTLVMLSLALGLVGMVFAWRQAADAAIKYEKLAEQRRADLYLADMRDAFRAQQSLRPDEVRRILQRHVPHAGQRDLRCVEWNLLDRLATPPSPLVLRGHAGHVNELAVVPGKPWILSVGEDGTVRVWDYHTGEPLSTMTSDGYPLHAVAISPDRQYVATGGSAPGDIWAIVRLWSVETKELVRELHEIPATVESLAFSPDGRHLAIGERNECVWLVNVADGALVARQPNGSRHKRLLFTSDGKHLISPAKFSGEAIPRTAIQVWDAQLQRTTYQFDLRFRDAMALSRNNRWLATSSTYSDEVDIYDLVDGKLITSRKISGDAIHGIEFSPDDKHLAVAHSDGFVGLWQVTSAAENGPHDGQAVEGIALANPRVFRAHEGEMRPIVFIDEDRFATCGVDGLVKIWRLAEMNPQWTGPQHVTIGGIVAGPESKCVAADANSNLWFLESAAEGFWTQVSKAPHRLSTFAISPDGKHLAVGLEDGALELRAGSNFERVRVLSHSGIPIKALEFSRCGKYLVSGSNHDTINVWRVEDGMLLFAMQHGAEDIRDLAISPSGLVAVAGTSLRTEVYDAGTGKRIHTLPLGTAVCSLDWSRDGKFLACGHLNGDIRVWDLEQNWEPIDLGNHRNRGRMVLRFLGDGTRLVSATGTTVRLWHLPTRRELGILYEAEPSASAVDLAIASDGGHLYATFDGAHLEQNIAVWKLK